MKKSEDVAFSKNPYIFMTRFHCERVDDDIVIIGSSRAAHHYIPKIMEEKLKKSVFNCGMDACFFLYQTAVIDCILNHYSPQLIIWDIRKPSELDSGIRESKDLAKLSKFNCYYDSNQYVNNLIQLKSRFEKYKMHSKLYRYNTCVNLSVYRTALSNYHTVFLESNERFKRKGYQPLYGIDKTLQKPKQVVHIKNIYYQKNVELFKHVLELCSQKNVPLVISFSPIFQDNRAFDTIQYKKLFEVANEYSVPIIDFYHHPDFMSDPSLFKDFGHLNDNGAKLFTKLFCDELEKLGILNQ